MRRRGGAQRGIRTSGRAQWREIAPRTWDEDTARFFASLKALDDRLKLPLPASFSPEKLFQGPIADALTHVGQLATLRRLAGAGVRGENYFVANIETGRVGADQAPGVREFD